jgi:hypothetical protein
VDPTKLLPIWLLDLSAFGREFWLFRLPPAWINTNADVLLPEDPG